MAATLPAFEEAKAIAALMSATSVPWMLSFVVRPNGELLDGTRLGDAIDRIDDSVKLPPAGYSINCVHPDIARQALSRVPPRIRSRLIAFQGNTSARSPEELDNLPHVDSTSPALFAASVMSLMGESSIRVVGGCCGTDGSHIAVLARRIGENANTRPE
jgi:S-methylmethionine-dependent homocysteine/selenocysteine methylase